MIKLMALTGLLHQIGSSTRGSLCTAALLDFSATPISLPREAQHLQTYRSPGASGRASARNTPHYDLEQPTGSASVCR